MCSRWHYRLIRMFFVFPDRSANGLCSALNACLGAAIFLRLDNELCLQHFQNTQQNFHG